MKELINLLVDLEYDFKYQFKSIYLDEVDCGYYGTVETQIKFNYYNTNEFTIFYGHKGFPQSYSVSTAAEMIDFMKSNHIIHLKQS